MAAARNVDDLLSALNGEKGKRWALRRFRLVKALGAAEDPRAVEALSKVVRTDRSAEVRDVAIAALGRIGDPTAIPALKDALRDPENGWVAMRNLGLLRDLSSVQEFIGWLGADNPLTRGFAADALGEIGDRSATPALVEALGDTKWSVRQSAAFALAKLGDPHALEPLRRAHRSGRCLSRRSIGKALAQLEKEGESNSKEPKKQIMFEQKFATPFQVAAMLRKTVGLRGTRDKRYKEAQYLAQNFSRNFFSDTSDQEPREFLEQTIEEFPDEPILRLLYVPMLTEIRPDDIAREAAKAVELGPDDPVVLVRAGHILLNEGDHDAASSCASRANELMAHDSIFMSDLENLSGLLAAFAGEDDLAEEKLRSAVEREPDNEPFAKNLAVFLAERGRLQQGAGVLDEALKHIEHKGEVERMRDRMAAEAGGS